MGAMDLRRMRHELKEWEHTFTSTHNRHPTKHDIFASPAIHSLYKEYARLKAELNTAENKSKKIHSVSPKLKGHSQNDKKNLPFAPQQELYARFSDRMAPPNSPSHSSQSDDSESSHISATPPKHKRLVQNFQSHKKSVPPKFERGASVDTQRIGMDNNIKTLNPCIPLLSSADHHVHIFRTTECLMSSTPHKNTASFKGQTMASDIPEQIDRHLQNSALGFRIRKQRCGQQLGLMESDTENFPAGFYANRISSARIAAAFASRRVMPEKQHIQSNNSFGTAEEDDSLREAELCAFQCQDSITDGETEKGLSCGFHKEQSSSDCIGVIVNELSTARQFDEPTSMIVDDASEKSAGQSNGAKHTCSMPGLIENYSDALPSQNNVCTVGLSKDSEGTQNGVLLNIDVSGENVQKDLYVKAENPDELTISSLKKVSARGLPIPANKTVLNHSNHETGKIKVKMKSRTKDSPTQKRKRHDDLDGTVTFLRDRIVDSISIGKNIASARTEEDDNVPVHTTTKQGRKNSHLHFGDTCPEDARKQVKRCRNSIGIKQETRVQSSVKSSRGTVAKKFARGRGFQIDLSKPRKQRTRENFVKLNINSKGGGRCRFKCKKRLGKSGRKVYGLKSRKMHKNGKVAAETVGISVVKDTDNEDDNLSERECENVLAHYCRERLNSFIDDASFAVPVEEAKARASLDPTEQNLLKVLNLVFGHTFFRPGQLETIQKVMAQQSTMLVLPTGSGKSLCYQLPAFLLPGITLVISPLVALMVDQFNSLPSLLPGAFLSCNQTFEEAASVLDKLRSGMLKVLFVSPERFFSENFVALLNDLPPVSLAVVDEAHCISEWSHNFRSSYFRLGSVLKNKLNVHSILAMTATATTKTIDSILSSLSIPSTGIVKAAQSQQNIQYSVSWSENRLKDLLSLLQTPPFSELSSIIVYCKFQSESDVVSHFLYDNRIQAKSYHAGMTSLDRIKMQKLFCCNKLRIVVATIAFGLGLNKSDVRAVIHFGLPHSLEQYVQETGRAGRDGKPAYCHLFLDDNTFLKLRSFSHSDNLDEYTLRRFLDKVFEGCFHENRSNQVRSIFIDSTERELDLKKEVMSTILSHLEVGDNQYVEIFSQVKATCLLRIHKSSIELLAKKNDLLTTILKSQSKRDQYTLNLPSLANNFGLSLAQMKQKLHELKVEGDISYELKDPAYCFRVLKVPEDISSLSSKFFLWFTKMENLKVKKLDFMYMIASEEASRFADVTGVNATSTSLQCPLQQKINSYFNMDETDFLSSSIPSIVKCTSPFLKADIKVFLQTSPQVNFTGRAVARIFHGIWSPAFPSFVWSSNHFWGRYTHVDFNAIKEAAIAEIRNLNGIRPQV